MSGHFSFWMNKFMINVSSVAICDATGLSDFTGILSSPVEQSLHAVFSIFSVSSLLVCEFWNYVNEYFLV